MDPAVRSFITTFNKALQGEMDAVARRYGASADLILVNPHPVDVNNPLGSMYRFDLSEVPTALVPGMECTLAYDGGEMNVIVVAVERATITLVCPQAIDGNAAPYRLVIYPAFLLQRLQQALTHVLDDDTFVVASALCLFGKREARYQPEVLTLDHVQLNASQQQAVQLCRDRSLAWIWGPPGTGKTRTLADIVVELLHGDARLLLTSTTNAAVDQALAKLAELPAMQAYFDENEIVRLGQMEGPTYGASLREVVLRRNADLSQQLITLGTRLQALQDLIRRCRGVCEQLKAEAEPAQLGLFAGSQPPPIIDFGPLFSTRHTNALRRQSAEDQLAVVNGRMLRLERLEAGYRRRQTDVRKAFAAQEQAAVREARVVLATTAHVYLSPLLEDERFDSVVVEEAGMALLPALFYCGCLAREKLVIVGDPRQLPAIVQSDDPFVRKYLGTNIFDLVVPRGEEHDGVVMLDVQYRMHPSIGDLVSRLSYGGRLHHDVTTRQRDSISAKRPYKGEPLVVVDTQGATHCAKHPGQPSRFNAESARLVVDLALEAVRDGIASVGIITPYSDQSRLVRRLLASYPTESEQIECRTVHRFQGGERDMIILDLVDTAPLTPGILLAGRGPYDASRQLVNVSISRARGKLVIVGDVNYFLSSAAGSAVADMLTEAAALGRQVVVAALDTAVS